MHTETDISIIIVNYNVKDFLLQCLRSIESAQNGLNIEVIVVDNNSSDSSIQFLKPIFPNVNFIELSENLGFAKANNIGVDNSSGKYILILNPDTIIEENTLQIMFDYMEEHTEIGASGCKVLNPDGSFQLACRRGFPTPWVAFTKLFGLQKMFPKSKLFAKYNQTYKSIDETYNIDAIIGAFMFFLREAFLEANGFDTDFFMYGEDLDLCYRIYQNGWKISYVHTTSIIHFKGESTKRSSINEIKYFYEAMSIFSKKHYSRSLILMLFIKVGILLRSFLAYLSKHIKEIFIILLDTIAINLALIYSTWYRFDAAFNFPDYAYPTVFITITLVMFFSMFAVGEYLENRHSVRRSLFGLMISFFILSSLTYYFKDFAFSRGVLLMTIGLTAFISVVIRAIFSLFSKTTGSESDKRIAIIGTNKQTENIIKSLQSAEIRNIDLVGIISVKTINDNQFKNLPLLGNIEYISKIIEQNKLDEIIITDKILAKNDLMRLFSKSSNSSVRFHIAQEYEELLVSRIINEITGIEPTIPKLSINILRFKVLKRIFDITISLFLLTIGLPIVYLLVANSSKTLNLLWKVLIGRFSIVGIYKLDNDKIKVGKEGIIGLVHISKPNQLSNEAIKNLNDYYRQYYSFSLDLDIIIKFLFRKKSGNKSNT